MNDLTDAFRTVFSCVLSTVFSVAGGPAAVDPPANASSPRIQAVRGPAEVDVAGVGTVTVPGGCFFTDAAGGTALLARTGFRARAELVGLLAPDRGGWIAWVERHPEGEALPASGGRIDRARLLRELQERARRDTEQRRPLGLPPLEVIGWLEQPAEIESGDECFWSIKCRSAGTGLRWYGAMKESPTNSLRLEVRELRPHAVGPLLFQELANRMTFSDPARARRFSAAADPSSPLDDQAAGHTPGVLPLTAWSCGAVLAVASVLTIVTRRKRLASVRSRAGPAESGGLAIAPGGMAIQCPPAVEGCRRHRVRRFDYDRFYHDLMRDL